MSLASRQGRRNLGRARMVEWRLEAVAPQAGKRSSSADWKPELTASTRFGRTGRGPEWAEV